MRRFFTILVGFSVIAAGFFGGFSADVLQSAPREPKNAVLRLRLVPSRVAQALRPAHALAAESGTLPLDQTYTSVMDTIRTHYYPTSTAATAGGGAPSSTKLTHAAIRGMLRTLGDPYTVFWTPDEFKAQMDEARGEFFGIGASLDTNDKKQVYIVEPIEKSPAMRAGIQRGDIILAVDDKSVVALNISSVVSRIKGKKGTPVTLTLQRGKEILKKTIIRDVIQSPVIKAWMQDPENRIGYIRLFQFNEQADHQFAEQLARLERQNIQGLIFDVRGNPGGLLEVARDIGSRFIREGVIVVVQEKNGRETQITVDRSKHRSLELSTGAYPIVVLIDGGSASASEIVAGAIKDHDVGTLVGTTTYGKGLVQTIIPVTGNGAVKVTTQRYFTPKHTDINKKTDETGKQISGGIEPDIKVELSEKDIEKMNAARKANPDDHSQDPQINKAVAILRDQISGKLPKPVAVRSRTTASAKP